VRYYLHSVRPIRIAAGPAGTVEYRFAEKFAELVTAKASDVRVSIITDESAAAATSRFARGDADLGFVRTDQKFPGSARALALIEHFAFILVVPKGSKIGSLGDLRGKKVAFVTSESGAEALFRSILTAFCPCRNEALRPDDEDRVQGHRRQQGAGVQGGRHDG
jgi:TRAP-type uncharacterized transport system substrate-binding protein